MWALIRDGGRLSIKGEEGSGWLDYLADCMHALSLTAAYQNGGVATYTRALCAREAPGVTRARDPEMRTHMVTCVCRYNGRTSEQEK